MVDGEGAPLVGEPLRSWGDPSLAAVAPHERKSVHSEAVDG
ncbi:MAG: hypothetical protein ACHBN1_15325 [Heteroscytonema crispum UTEX LB 1556]